ncbi:hypothetical protein F4780DRAFT_720432, partial [Xylariomycetidae sp. FL0641]
MGIGIKIEEQHHGVGTIRGGLDHRRYVADPTQPCSRIEWQCCTNPRRRSNMKGGDDEPRSRGQLGSTALQTTPDEEPQAGKAPINLLHASCHRTTLSQTGPQLGTIHTVTARRVAWIPVCLPAPRPERGSSEDQTGDYQVVSADGRAARWGAKLNLRLESGRTHIINSIARRCHPDCQNCSIAGPGKGRDGMFWAGAGAVQSL